jgi:hypothetical protein
MTTRYNPPTAVKTLEMPYKVLVLRADPNHEQAKRKEPFYEFTGRRFDDNTANKGAYSSATNGHLRISSNGGGATAAISMPDHTISVTTVVAADAEPEATVRYSIVGGADAAKFQIGPGGGQLIFSIVPDFETPADADADNVYVVTVQASDGLGKTVTQTISVTITEE